ncbi:hypothetical protein [Microcoleus sp. MON2_D5]|uniref:hypothetical protein n=1 Tax=Microcoleus sp. MON2_D5 TaxID=2818833 RepID=UPI002FCE6E0B
MNPKKLEKVQARVRVLERLIESFSYCRKLVRRYVAELIDKEVLLRHFQVQAASYSVNPNGQLCLF